MRVTLLLFLGGLASAAIAQEPPSSQPTSAPASTPTSLPLDEAASALNPDSAPSSALSTALPYLTPPTIKPPQPDLKRSNPVTAGALAILPGAGHLYLGQPLAAGGYFATEVGTIALLSGATKAQLPGLVLGSVFQNLLFYNIFDAYRDARVKRLDDGYHYAITREPLAKLASAPFRPSVLRKPWVWAGVPTALIGGLGVSLLAEELFPSAKITPMSLRTTPLFRGQLSAALSGEDAVLIATGSAVFAATFMPVGVGEESLFRGCFQSGLTQQFGPIGGWLSASALFGAAHIGNFVERDPITGARTGFNEAGYLAVPYITLVGAGLGYIYMKEDYKLEAGVAAHFWYDFLLSVGSLFSLANDGTASLQLSFQL